MRRFSLTLLSLAIVSLWLLSMPFTASQLAGPLENIEPFNSEYDGQMRAEAIVILGGGGCRMAREFGSRDNVSRLTMERLRYGARLHRATGLGIAVSGGATGKLNTPEAILMQSALESDFGVPVRWIEAESQNTAENAAFSRNYFAFDTIVLVTHAIHMRRAVGHFEEAGFGVIPAPLGFVSKTDSGTRFTDFLPTVHGLLGSRQAMYEYLGGIWHQLSY